MTNVKTKIMMLKTLFIGQILLNARIISAVNLKPNIGVLAQATGDMDERVHGDTYLISSYVRYLELAGAQVVPIKMREPDDYYDKLFKSINGVLFPGGAVSLTTSDYAKVSNKVINYAKEAYDQGDVFPVWGTCLGFEQIATSVAGEDLLSKCNGINTTLSLEFTDDTWNSTVYKDLPEDLKYAASHWNITQNEHMYCLSPSSFQNSTNLTSTFRITSTNFDLNGTEFISSIEAYNYPIYAVQYHPEKNLYDWDPRVNVNHSTEAVKFAQYLANFFVEKCRESNHSFVTIEEERDALIYNYRPVYLGLPSLQVWYFFNYTHRDDQIYERIDPPEYHYYYSIQIPTRYITKIKRGLAILPVIIIGICILIMIKRYFQLACATQRIYYYNAPEHGQKIPKISSHKTTNRLPFVNKKSQD